EPESQLACSGGLPRPVHPHHHHDRQAVVPHVEGGRTVGKLRHKKFCQVGFHPVRIPNPLPAHFLPQTLHDLHRGVDAHIRLNEQFFQLVEKRGVHRPPSRRQAGQLVGKSFPGAGEPPANASQQSQARLVSLRRLAAIPQTQRRRPPSSRVVYPTSSSCSDTRDDTPGSFIVTPYKQSAASMVGRRWVMAMTCDRSAVARSRRVNRCKLASSKLASTSSSTQNGAGRTRMRAKIRARAVSARSPPDKASKWRDGLPGSCTWTSTPPRRGSSSSVRLRWQWPPGNSSPN